MPKREAFRREISGRKSFESHATSFYQLTRSQIPARRARRSAKVVLAAHD
jgi:hypothetical protein